MADSTEEIESQYFKLVRSAMENPGCPGTDDNQKRIEFILKFVGSDDRSHFMYSIFAGKKSSEKSDEHKKLGKQYAEETCCDKAVEEFTKSVAYAPNESQELAAAFGIRRSVLSEIFPTSGLERTREFDLNSNYEKNGRETLSGVRNLLIQDQNLEDKSLTQWDSMKFLPELDVENPKVPGISDAIELRYSEEFGRYLVAARDIKPGEILSVEKAYAKMICQNSRYKFCWNCGKQAWESLPCESCVEVVFCSETCRKIGNDEHHRIECPITASVIPLGIEDDDIMALRLFVKAYKEEKNSLENLQLKIAEIEAETNPLAKGFTNGVLDPEKFSSVYCLQTDLEKITDCRVRGLSNSILIAYIFATRTKFLDSEKDENLLALAARREFIFLVGLLERLGSIVRINSFQICHFDSEKTEMESSIVVAPTLSLFNHSCDPTSSRTDHGAVIVSTAHRSVRKGEQIFGCYGMNYKFSDKQERQETLKNNYHFICQCEACTNDWKLPRTIEEFKSDRERELFNEIRRLKIKCHKAMKHLVSFGRWHNEYYDPTNDMTKIIEIIEECYRLGFERNYFVTYEAEETLICFIQLKNDRYLSLDSPRP